MQLSGELAYQHGEQAYDFADSVSRLDLAVTLVPASPDPNLGRSIYEQAKAFRDERPNAAEPWFVGGASGGWTTYIGKRQSDTFFRCYDKGAESRAAGDEAEAAQYDGAWRFELELKGDYAERTAQALYRSGDQQGYTLGHVWRYLSDHGVNVPFDVDGPIHKLAQLRRRSDRDRKLDWLARQVRPTVTWLAENGDSASILAALGLAIIDNNLCQLACQSNGDTK
jgi:DNA relaxase NicK